MGSHAPEMGIERQEIFSDFITPGVARFVVVANPDAHFRRFYNPMPMHFANAEEREMIRRAIVEQADVEHIDLELVNKISAGIREVTTEEKEQEGKTREEQKREWAGQMVTFLRKFASSASPDFKELAQKTIGVDLSSNDSAFLWGQAGKLWKTYLSKENGITVFLENMVSDITSMTPEDAVEVQKRIQVFSPFFGLFGDSRVSVLMRDSLSAVSLLVLDAQSREKVVEKIIQSLQNDFSTQVEKGAYQLVWDIVKNMLPPQERRNTPQSRTATPPAQAVEPSTPPVEPDKEAPAVQKKEEIPPSQEPVAPRQPTVSKKPETPEKIQEAPLAPAPAPVPSLQQKAEIGKGEKPSPPEKQSSEAKQPEAQTFVTTAAMARDPQRPWTPGDALLAKEFGNGGFVIGAFDGLRRGGGYSDAVAAKLRQLCLKRFGKYSEPPPLDVAIRQAVHIFKEIQPFVENVQKGAESELLAMKADSKQVKQLVNSIGTTGLLGVTAQSGDEEFLVTINLGNSRLLMFDPQKGSLTPLTVDQTVGARKERVGVVSAEEAFIDEHRAHLSRWVRGQNVDDVERQFDEQMSNGWSRTDEVLRVFPLQKGKIYLALTNGITLNIPPWELPAIVEKAYTSGFSRDRQRNLSFLAGSIVKEARKRMKNPQQYTLTVRGKDREYGVSDDAGVAAVWAS